MCGGVGVREGGRLGEGGSLGLHVSSSPFPEKVSHEEKLSMYRYGLRGWLGWGVALTISLGIVGAILLPPFVGPEGRALIMQAFAGVCHQLPARSLQLGDVPLAVCDRCLGIYGGLALGVLGFPTAARWQEVVHRNAGLVLIAVLVPMAADWAGPILDLWANVPLSRGVTGGLFGVAAGYLVARATVRATGPSADPPMEPRTRMPASTRGRR